MLDSLIGMNAKLPLSEMGDISLACGRAYQLRRAGDLSVSYIIGFDLRMVLKFLLMILVPIRDELVLDFSSLRGSKKQCASTVWGIHCQKGVSACTLGAPVTGLGGILARDAPLLRNLEALNTLYMYRVAQRSCVRSDKTIEKGVYNHPYHALAILKN